jgi:hypothetical protein
MGSHFFDQPAYTMIILLICDWDDKHTCSTLPNLHSQLEWDLKNFLSQAGSAYFLAKFPLIFYHLLSKN